MLLATHSPTFTTPTLTPSQASNPPQSSDSETASNPTPPLEHLIRLAMLDCDRYVLEIDYLDTKGKRTRRMVSPIRFGNQDEMFLGLCLCREEPRQFRLARCHQARLVPAEDVVMPVEIVHLDA